MRPVRRHCARRRTKTLFFFPGWDDVPSSGILKDWTPGGCRPEWYKPDRAMPPHYSAQFHGSQRPPRTEAMVADGPTPSPGQAFIGLTLGSIGVVYGDIGTSPLYALREAVTAAGGVAGREVVFGILSLILWALILVVTCKYVLVLLRADNNGEGGTLTLMALSRRVTSRSLTFLYFGIIGAALFFGDALITPAISVLSAIEGMKIATPAFDHYVVPLTVLFWYFCSPSNRVARRASPLGSVRSWRSGLSLLDLPD